MCYQLHHPGSVRAVTPEELLAYMNGDELESLHLKSVHRWLDRHVCKSVSLGLCGFMMGFPKISRVLARDRYTSRCME